MTDNFLSISRITIVLTAIYFCGFVHIVSYYNEFGYRFSDLNLEYYHIFYRGMDVIFGNLIASALFISLSLFCLIDCSAYRIWLLGGYRKAGPILDAGIVLIFLVIWPVASMDGFRAAQRDGVGKSTLLRKVVSIKDKSNNNLPVFQGLLNQENVDAVYLVRKSGSQIDVIAPPVDGVQGAFKPSVTHILLQSGDSYVEAP